uniref:Uncharacterized protein n=1 Tax=viral metagenome TaxID=1070528 RepID=A0A6H1ZPT7_9ZZZZ
MTTKTKTQKKLLIKATIKILGRYYSAEGKTVEETLLKLQLPVAKTVAVLTLQKGELERIKILSPSIVSGVWGKRGKTPQIIAMKHLNLLFGDFN